MWKANLRRCVLNVSDVYGVEREGAIKGELVHAHVHNFDRRSGKCLNGVCDT